MENVEKIFPTVYFSRYTDPELPAFIGEKRILYLTNKGDKAEQIYKTLYNNIRTFTQKVPESHAKQAVQILLDRNMIRIGRDIDSSKNGIIGRAVVNHGKLASIILEVVDLEIDPETGETDNIDAVFYAAYLQFIRAVVIISNNDIRVNKELHSLCTSYLSLLFLRLLGSNVYLNDKQKIFLDAVIKYFYYRFQIFEQHPKAVEFAAESSNSDELYPILESFKKYNNMKDIFKAIPDIKLSNDQPQQLLISALTKMKATGFYAITTSIDYLISLIITTLYPVNFLPIGTINSSIQGKLEKLVFNNYLLKTKFDSGAVQ